MKFLIAYDGASKKGKDRHKPDKTEQDGRTFQLRFRTGCRIICQEPMENNVLVVETQALQGYFGDDVERRLTQLQTCHQGSCGYSVKKILKDHR
jgi:hypothetical protein